MEEGIAGNLIIVMGDVGDSLVDVDGDVLIT